MRARRTLGTRVADRRAELRTLGRRSREIIVLAAVVGVVTGAGVALFETIVSRLLESLHRLPLWAVATMPLAGLAVAAASLRWIGQESTPATADEYIQTFHDPRRRLDLRSLFARMIGGIATLGSGAPMGLEGPSQYMGASVGDLIRRRLPQTFAARHSRVLLVAGAAAGVAAIFKAPATGAVFALEVPYQDDLARHMLLPSLVASTSGYMAFVAIHGTTPLLPVTGHPPVSFRDLAAAVVLGLVAGFGARAFALMVRRAKDLSSRIAFWARLPAAGAVLAAVFVLGRLATGESLTTGPGYDTIRWALDPSLSVWVVGVILALRCIGTSAAVAGGGVGGMFIPLVVAGALAGRIVGGAVHVLDTSLFTVIGAAAFLGAGYRVPLAAVMFIAEVTGRPGFVVPGLLASVVAELLMGRSSVTVFQRGATTDQGWDDDLDPAVT